MSQPNNSITENVMHISTTPIPTARAFKTDGPLSKRRRISRAFNKMLTQKPLPPVPVSAPEDQTTSPSTNNDTNSSKHTIPEAKSRNRMSRMFSKRLSTPVTTSTGTGTPENKINTSRFSLAILPSRNKTNQIPATEQQASRPASIHWAGGLIEGSAPTSTSTPTSRPSSHVPSLASTRVSSSTSLSTAPSSLQSSRSSTPSITLSKPTTPPGSSQLLYNPSSSLQSTSQSPYNPLANYVPCLFPGCKTHYLRTAPSPTFYLPQVPYNLHRKRGLCPAHATQDLKQANLECKIVYERMRQNAGRRTLREVAADFDSHIQRFDQDREAESRLLELSLQLKVTGRGESRARDGMGKRVRFGDDEKMQEQEEQQWNWRYTPRPCTKAGCLSPHYSPYSSSNYIFYFQRRRSGLRPLPNLCPSCAQEDLDLIEAVVVKQSKEEMDDEEWVHWLENVNKDRHVERRFWEGAQERVVLEKRERKTGREGRRNEIKGENKRMSWWM